MTRLRCAELERGYCKQRKQQDTKLRKGQVWHIRETKRKKPVWLKYNEKVKVGGGTGEASKGQTMLGSETMVKVFGF